MGKMRHSLGSQALKNLPHICNYRKATTAFSNYLLGEHQVDNSEGVTIITLPQQTLPEPAPCLRTLCLSFLLYVVE